MRSSSSSLSTEMLYSRNRDKTCFQKLGDTLQEKSNALRIQPLFGRKHRTDTLLNTPWFQKLAVIHIISGLTKKISVVLRAKYSMKATLGQTDLSLSSSITLFS